MCPSTFDAIFLLFNFSIIAIFPNGATYSQFALVQPQVENYIALKLKLNCWQMNILLSGCGTVEGKRIRTQKYVCHPQPYFKLHANMSVYWVEIQNWKPSVFLSFLKDNVILLSLQKVEIVTTSVWFLCTTAQLKYFTFKVSVVVIVLLLPFVNWILQIWNERVNEISGSNYKQNEYIRVRVYICAEFT